MTSRPLAFAILLSTLTACGGGGGGGGEGSGGEDNGGNGAIPTDPPVVEGEWYRPTVGVTWQWQLQGALNTGYDVEIYDVDLFDTSAPDIADLQAQGRKVICYFSAGSYENWRPDIADFTADDTGNPLDDWEGEVWLDVRSANVRSIMAARLDLARDKGCDGVEPDNVDAYTYVGSGFPLTAQDQADYNAFIANAAHDRGLAVALKNDLDQVDALVDYFDFAVNEQCAEYDECDRLSAFIDAGKPVLHAEYAERYVASVGERETLCQQSATLQLSTLVLPLDLDDAYRYSCE
jgi:hypothetical protein